MCYFCINTLGQPPCEEEPWNVNQIWYSKIQNKTTIFFQFPHLYHIIVNCNPQYKFILADTVILQNKIHRNLWHWRITSQQSIYCHWEKESTTYMHTCTLASSLTHIRRYMIQYHYLLANLCREPMLHLHHCSEKMFLHLWLQKCKYN
jgi:hypothetical protein